MANLNELMHILPPTGGQNIVPPQIATPYDGRLLAAHKILLGTKMVSVHYSDVERVRKYKWYVATGNNFIAKIKIPFVMGSSGITTFYPKKSLKTGTYNIKYQQVTLTRFIKDYSSKVKAYVVQIGEKNDFTRDSLQTLWNPGSRLIWGKKYKSPFIGVEIEFFHDRPIKINSFDPISEKVIFTETIIGFSHLRRLNYFNQQAILQAMRDIEVRAAFVYDAYMIKTYGTYVPINFLNSLGI